MKKINQLILVSFAMAGVSCKSNLHEIKPNILLFITDDESWVERSAYGWTDTPTPNFDMVAAQGVLFTNAYTSAPSCAPSRASLLTGRNFWELEQGAFIQAFLPMKFQVFPALLEKNGYYVGHTGKTWGPGIYPGEAHGETVGNKYNKASVNVPIDGIANNDYAGNFESFLNDRTEGQPFFFWAGVYEPHLPNGEENYKRLEKEYGISLDQIKLFPGELRENRQDRANYIYEICYTDLHLGRMLELLKTNGELENTLIVVTSDNGTWVERKGEFVGKASPYDPVGKASPYDLGVHEPMAIMWPSHVKAGRKITDFVTFADLAPTFLEAAGITPPEGMSGSSILPLLESGKSGRIDTSRNMVVTGLEWHGEFDPVSRSSRTIRDDRFAYIVHYNNVDENGENLSNEEAIRHSKIEFYDLVKDPWQLNDLSNNPDYNEEKEKLAEKLHQYGTQTSDPRVTGEMDLFLKTRQFVQKRKRIGYDKTLQLPY